MKTSIIRFIYTNFNLLILLHETLFTFNTKTNVLHEGETNNYFT